MPRTKGIFIAFMVALAPQVSGCGNTTTSAVPVASVTVAPASLELIQGQSRSLTATLRDEAGNLLGGRTVTWRSGNTAVATVDAAGTVVAVGPGQAEITATSEGASGSTALTVHGRALIALDPTDVRFTATRGEADPGPASVQISNTGESALTDLIARVTYTGGASGWLSTSLTSTSAPSTLRLTASVLGIETGVHTARVDLESPDAGNSPQAVTVTFDVLEPPPVIGLSTDLVELQATEQSLVPSSASIDVANEGGDTLDGLEASIAYMSGESHAWLQATLTSTVAPARLVVSATAGGLPPGAYEATVTVTAPDALNSPQPVAVHFTVVPRETGGDRSPARSSPGASWP